VSGEALRQGFRRLYLHCPGHAPRQPEEIVLLEKWDVFRCRPPVKEIVPLVRGGQAGAPLSEAIGASAGGSCRAIGTDSHHGWRLISASGADRAAGTDPLCVSRRWRSGFAALSPLKSGTIYGAGRQRPTSHFQHSTAPAPCPQHVRRAVGRPGGRPAVCPYGGLRPRLNIPHPMAPARPRRQRDRLAISGRSRGRAPRRARSR
jgi:hypothetical protein